MVGRITVSKPHGHGGYWQVKKSGKLLYYKTSNYGRPEPAMFNSKMKAREFAKMKRLGMVI